MAWASQDNNKEYDNSNVEVAVPVVVNAAINGYKIRAPKAMSWATIILNFIDNKWADANIYIPTSPWSTSVNAYFMKRVFLNMGIPT